MATVRIDSDFGIGGVFRADDPSIKPSERPYWAIREALAYLNGEAMKRIPPAPADEAPHIGDMAEERAPVTPPDLPDAGDGPAEGDDDRTPGMSGSAQ